MQPINDLSVLGTWPTEAEYSAIHSVVMSAAEADTVIDHLAPLIEARESAAVVRTLRDRAKYHRALADEHRGVSTTAHTVHLVLAGDYDAVAHVVEGPAAGVSREATP